MPCEICSGLQAYIDALVALREHKHACRDCNTIYFSTPGHLGEPRYFLCERFLELENRVEELSAAN
jgi:hypothetical protein